MLAAAATQREAALKSELQGLKLGQLCTRAMKEGVDALALEQAQDSDTPKEAVIALLLKAAAEQMVETPRHQKQGDEQVAAENGDGQADTELVGRGSDASRASSSPASNPTEPGTVDASATAVNRDRKTLAGERSTKRGRRGRRTMQLSCPQCSEDFQAHAPVKQKRTRKCRCGGKSTPRISFRNKAPFKSLL